MDNNNEKRSRTNFDEGVDIHSSNDTSSPLMSNKRRKKGFHDYVIVLDGTTPTYFDIPKLRSKQEDNEKNHLIFEKEDNQNYKRNMLGPVFNSSTKALVDNNNDVVAKVSEKKQAKFTKDDKVQVRNRAELSSTDNEKDIVRPKILPFPAPTHNTTVIGKKDQQEQSLTSRIQHDNSDNDDNHRAAAPEESSAKDISNSDDDVGEKKIVAEQIENIVKDAKTVAVSDIEIISISSSDDDDDDDDEQSSKENGITVVAKGTTTTNISSVHANNNVSVIDKVDSKHINNSGTISGKENKDVANATYKNNKNDNNSVSVIDKVDSKHINGTISGKENKDVTNATYKSNKNDNNSVSVIDKVDCKHINGTISGKENKDVNNATYKNNKNDIESQATSKNGTKKDKDDYDRIYRTSSDLCERLMKLQNQLNILLSNNRDNVSNLFNQYFKVKNATIDKQKLPDLATFISAHNAGVEAIMQLKLRDENFLRKEILGLSAQLQKSEEERKRAWDKMNLVTKAQTTSSRDTHAQQPGLPPLGVSQALRPQVPCPPIGISSSSAPDRRAPGSAPDRSQPSLKSTTVPVASRPSANRLQRHPRRPPRTGDSSKSLHPSRRHLTVLESLGGATNKYPAGPLHCFPHPTPPVSAALRSAPLAGDAVDRNASNNNNNTMDLALKYSKTGVIKRTATDGSVAPVKEPQKTKDGRFMRPAGRGRKGMVWDDMRGIWVPIFATAKNPIKTKDGLFARPVGRTPKGMDWDDIRGIWVPEGSRGFQV